MSQIDIKDVVNSVINKKRNFYDELDEAGQKAISPFMLIKWVSRKATDKELLHLNSYVNTKIFPLHKHPKLLCLSMIACVKGGNRFVQWVPFVKQSKQSKLLKLVMDYYGYNKSHAKDALKLLSSEQIISMAEDLAYEASEIKEIQKELKS